MTTITVKEPITVFWSRGSASRSLSRVPLPSCKPKRLRHLFTLGAENFSSLRFGYHFLLPGESFCLCLCQERIQDQERRAQVLSISIHYPWSSRFFYSLKQLCEIALMHVYPLLFSSWTRELPASCFSILCLSNEKKVEILFPIKVYLNFVVTRWPQ